jgi:hypothetical protein
VLLRDVLARARQDSAGDLPGEEDAGRTKSNFFFVRLEWEVSYLASLCIKPSVLFMWKLITVQGEGASDCINASSCAKTLVNVSRCWNVYKNISNAAKDGEKL